MSVLNYFKNTPGRPPIGRHDLSNFFPSNLQRGPWKKKGACRPCDGRQGPVAPLGRPVGGPAHGRGRGLSPPPRATGGLSPPIGRPGYPPYIRSNPPSLLISARKFQQKSRKKERGEKKGSGEALSDSALVICRLVHLVYIFFYLSTTHLSRSNLSTGE